MKMALENEKWEVCGGGRVEEEARQVGANGGKYLQFWEGFGSYGLGKALWVHKAYRREFRLRPIVYG